MNTEQKLQALIEKAEEFKAFDIKAYDVRGVCSYADFFLFLSGTSSVQIQSLAEALILLAKKADCPPLGWEGLDLAEWCLIDFGDILEHLFQPEKREFFEMEALWQRCPQVYSSPA